MTVAAISCTFVPLGTILGAFTIAALLKPEIKEQSTKSQQIAATNFAENAK